MAHKTSAAAELPGLFRTFMGQINASRRPAVAVSGGADSMCLAVLAFNWGDPLALIVDHGIRAGSADEAELTGRRLASLGIKSRILRLDRLTGGAGVAARARTARYAALTAAMREAGRVDLLLGHHRRDQAETVMMRQRAGSGPSGLSGMAAIAETQDIRLLRPFLPVPPGALRAYLDAAGIGWVEDPTNRDMTALRARLREELADTEGCGKQVGRLVSEAARYADRRADCDRHCAAELADRALFFPEGYALLSPGPLSPPALGALIRGVRGAPYAAASASLARMAACPSPACLGGIQLVPAGKRGQGWLVVREACAMSPPVPARAGAMWDGRFLVERDAGENAMVGAVADDAAKLRRHSFLPTVILRTLPALRVAGTLVEVPHIGYRDASGLARLAVSFAPATPASGAPFGAVQSGDAEGEVHPHLQG